MLSIFISTHKNILLGKALVIAVTMLLGLSAVSPVDAAQDQPIRMLILFSPASQQTDAVSAAVQSAGGHVFHLFPGAGLIATVPASAQEEIAGLADVAATFTQPVDIASLRSYGPAVQLVAAVWNSLLTPSPAEDDDLASAGDPEDHRDMLMAPDRPLESDLSLAETSVRPGYYDTSEFMAGSVAVGLVLLESDGSIDPSTEDWTSAEKQLVFSEIVNATNWWAQLEPRAHLTFVYEDHYTNPLPTGVEPISHRAFDYTGYGENKWIGDAMATLGYTAPSYFTRVRDYNNHLRDSYNTDWAFTIFVVDSSLDGDNRFADGYFAYAYLGGPFMVMTSGNDGYGATNMDAVAAHEMGHIFNALDQYYSAGQTCTQKAGYLAVENQNSQYGGCSSNVTSIMRGQIYPFTAQAIDAYGAGQVGWRDSDGDNVLDPLDTDLPISITSAEVDDDRLTVTGQAAITPYPAPLQTDITINNLSDIQYRIDGQSWQPATLLGEFGDASASFQFTLQSMPYGTHTLDVIATDSAGNRSETVATTQFTITEHSDGGLNTELYLPADPPEAGQTVLITGLAYDLKEGATVSAVEYRISGSDWQPAIAQDGAFDSDYEPFYFSLNLLTQSETSLVLEARAADDSGYQEQTPATQDLVLGGSYQVFLPVVLR